MFKIELSDITISGLKNQLEHHLNMIKAFATSAIEKEIVKEEPATTAEATEAAPAKGKRGPKPKTLAESNPYPQPAPAEESKSTLFKQLAEKRDAAFKVEEPASEPKAEPAPVASISYKQVSDATLEAIKMHGRDKVIGMLNEDFKAPTARDLRPEQYAKYLEALTLIGGDNTDLV